MMVGPGFLFVCLFLGGGFGRPLPTHLYSFFFKVIYLLLTTLADMKVNVLNTNLCMNNFFAKNP